jgi:DNA mismatch endonuclease, patch repair protein
VGYRPKPADEVRRNMSAIRSRDNRTELALRKALFAAGLRFRLHRRDLSGNPDIVFVGARVAVFVDGDFWHARSLREKGIEAVRRAIRTPTQSYWLAKFARRVVRDDEVSEALRKEGWRVMRFWESDVKRDLQKTVRAVVRAVKRRGRKANR